MAEIPSTAFFNVSASRRSPSTVVDPAGTSLPGRTSARQFTPASTKRRNSREPTSPVPPVIKIVILDFLLICVCRGVGLRPAAHEELSPTPRGSAPSNAAARMRPVGIGQLFPKLRARADDAKRPLTLN